MSTTWEEASACPEDGTPGKVDQRQRLPFEQGGGQLVTLTCKQTRCIYHKSGWVVQVRPDNTIPDKVDPHTRDRRFMRTSMTSARRQMVVDALSQQVENEQRAGAEVRRL